MTRHSRRQQPAPRLPVPHPDLEHRMIESLPPGAYDRMLHAVLEAGREQVEREQRFVALFRPPVDGAR